MKITRKYLPIWLLAVVLPFGGCNVVKKTADKVSGGSDVQKEVVLPTDREKIVQPVSAGDTS